MGRLSLHQVADVDPFGKAGGIPIDIGQENPFRDAVQSRYLTSRRHQLVTVESLAIEIARLVRNRIASVNKWGWLGLVRHMKAVDGVGRSIARLARRVNQSDRRSQGRVWRPKRRIKGRTSPARQEPVGGGGRR